MSSFRVKDSLFSFFFLTEAGFVVVSKLWSYRANSVVRGCRHSHMWKLMYDVFLLDDALDDLKSQKKKIVSKTSKSSCCGPLKCFCLYKLSLMKIHKWKAETGRGEGGEAINVALFSYVF